MGTNYAIVINTDPFMPIVNICYHSNAACRQDFYHKNNAFLRKDIKCIILYAQTIDFKSVF